MTKTVTRLNAQFSPNHYDLILKPNREDKTFTGSVTIGGQKVGRPSQRLTFHQNGLTITSAKITKHNKKGDTEIEVARINHHKSFDEVRLHSDEMLYPGQYTVTLEFKGLITGQMNGMYPCVFTHQGETKELIATQFESHHAREVFPCVDEPEAKATFDLTLTTPAGETVLSNTPIKSQTESDGQLTSKFETTPIMSTYLLAFVYGEMDYREAKTKSGVVVRTYATPDNAAFTEFALDCGVRMLDFYEDYFGIPFPLEKCDMVALPDFASGAMENWGLITYREQTMLVDPDNTSLSAKQYVAMVIGHELAHQWFGNLVTMRWWTDLWLNEGFASWIEYMAVDHLFPEWEMWTQFIIDEQQLALKLDALEHTHPIEVPVNHPDEIRTIFDAISYSKGASVIHMLHDYLGADDFRDGLRHYLKQHAYNNTDTVDLWTALEAVTDKPVKSFMQAWTSQSGFPIVKAEVSDSKVELTQERYFINKSGKPKDDTIWPIATLSQDKSIDPLITKAATTFNVDGGPTLKLNRGQSGFYRTIYNQAHLDQLGKQIKSGQLPAVDRVGILSDLFESAKAGYTDTVAALGFLQNFDGEDNYAAWDAIASVVGSIRLHIATDEQLREQMKPYIRSLTAKQLDRLGWEAKAGESHFDKLLRPVILGLAASADEPSVVKRCLELFEAIPTPAKDERPQITIDPDLRGVVFGTIARLGGSAEFNKLLKLHNASLLSEEKLTFAAALTSFKQDELIDRSLQLITSDDVRKQDATYWVAYSFMNRHARTQTWEWMKQHWSWLEEHFGSDMGFSRMPIYSARVFNDTSFLEEYKKFFEPLITPALERSFNQGIEMISWQSDWRSRDYDKVANFFSSNQ